MTTKLLKVEGENTQLKDQIKEIQDDYDSLADSVYDLEKDLHKLAQYGRRQNLQISGIKKNIGSRKIEDLEFYVVNLLNLIGVHVTKEDIIGCHRLYQKDPSKPADTIVRFVNRKNVVKARKNAFKMKSMALLNIYASLTIYVLVIKNS